MLVKKLDKRAKMVTSNCQAKPRNVSSPSERGVPDDAPKWAINPTYVLDKENTSHSVTCTNALAPARKTLEFEESACSSLSEEDLDLV